MTATRIDELSVKMRLYAIAAGGRGPTLAASTPSAAPIVAKAAAKRADKFISASSTVTQQYGPGDYSGVGCAGCSCKAGREAGQFRVVVRKGSKFQHDNFVRAMKLRPHFTVEARGLTKEGDALEDGSGLPPQVQLDEVHFIDWDAVFEGNSVCDAIFKRQGLNRKANLALMLSKYMHKHPDTALTKCWPETFVVDTYEAFGGSGNASYSMSRRAALRLCTIDVVERMEEEPGSLWIMKPSMFNKGMAICIVNTEEAMLDSFEDNDEIHAWVVQRYVERPLLIAGRKFHLRMYMVAVGGMKVFMFREGLLFFAIRKFNKLDGSLDDQYTHITNASVSEHHSKFNSMKFIRRTSQFSKLLMKDQGMSAEEAMAASSHVYCQIRRVIAHSFHSCSTEVGEVLATPTTFEMMAADFIVDESFNPQLLEFNAGPDIAKCNDDAHFTIVQLIAAAATVGIDSHAMFRGPEHEATCPASRRKYRSCVKGPLAAAVLAGSDFEDIVGAEYPAFRCVGEEFGGEVLEEDGVTVACDAEHTFGSMDLVYSHKWRSSSQQLNLV